MISRSADHRLRLVGAMTVAIAVTNKKPTWLVLADCRGVLISDSTDYLEPDPGHDCISGEILADGLAKVLKVCAAGHRCRIKGWVVSGHGGGWLNITSVTRLRPRQPRAAPGSTGPRASGRGLS